MSSVGIRPSTQVNPVAASDFSSPFLFPYKAECECAKRNEARSELKNSLREAHESERSAVLFSLPAAHKIFLILRGSYTYTLYMVWVPNWQGAHSANLTY